MTALVFNALLQAAFVHECGHRCVASPDAEGGRVARGVPTNDTSMSSVTPASRASGAEIIRLHHIGGMLSRCHHLDTVCVRAPSSAAIASQVGHNEITSRKDFMPRSIVHNVYSRNPYTSSESRDCNSGQVVLRLPPMGHDISEDDFKEAVFARIKKAREDKGWSQMQMALILQIEHGTYHKYECRTIMPLFLMMQFCFHTGVTVDDITYGPTKSVVRARAKITKARGRLRARKRA